MLTPVCDWRAEVRGRQRTICEEEKGRAQLVVSTSPGPRLPWRRTRRRWRAQLLVISIQLARKNIFLVEAALEKAVRKGWFSRQQELEAGENIRQTKLEIRATRDQYMRTKEGFVIVL